MKKYTITIKPICIGSRSNYDVDLEWLLLLQYVCKYCIVTMDWTSRISYVHTGQYYYYYNNRPTTNRIGLHKKVHSNTVTKIAMSVNETRQLLPENKK